MTEQKVKKRGWVKNVAIIFLSVMLFLTFFSNTWMNRTLPEVAAQYVQSGSINAKIRGSGAVTANESFEVKTNQTRKVLSVPVKLGDTVKVGDVLINFADADSTEIKQAQDALDTALFAYKEALLDGGDGSHPKEKRDIERAQRNLDDAKAKQLANAYSQADYNAARASFETLKAQANAQQLIVDDLQSQLSGMTPPTFDESNSAAITAKQNEKKAKENEKASALLIHNKADLKLIDDKKIGAYDLFRRYATNWKLVDEAGAKRDLKVYLDALYDDFSAQLAATPAPEKIALPFAANDLNLPKEPTFANATKMVNAYKAVSEIDAQITAIDDEIRKLQSSGSGSTGDYNYYTVKNKLDTERKALSALNTNKAAAELTYTTLKEKKEAYDAATEAVYTGQDALETALTALEQAQKADKKYALNIEKLKDSVNDSTKALSELKAGGTSATVTSQVNGVVSQVNATAGNNTNAGDTLMTVEIPDRGYSVSLSVTIEQSKKVKVGDSAEVMYNYWGSNTQASLSAIKSDPKSQGKNKLLVFDIKGDVESGSQLSLSIGERGGSYDTIVPNSAIRSDNNGNFVLAVIAKSGPLGNRYVAQRIDVKVLAKDDVNTAVSGALNYNEFVVTNSTKPIEPGMQVRLPD